MTLALTVLGIEGTFVWLAYVLCLASVALCIGYGLWRWNKDEEPAKQEDVKWADQEMQAREEEN